MGPDGRLYAGAAPGQTYPAVPGGVFRTTAPVAVAGEASAVPEAPPGVGVSVRPNPAGGRAEVVLSLAEALRRSASQCSTHSVARWPSSTTVLARAGEQRLAVDTASWPAGVYVVRASAGPQSASARLVVAR